jgi:hypothetical protein
MRFIQIDPLILVGYGIEPLPESIWRYETMLVLINGEYNQGREIAFFGDNPDAPDEGSAGWIIDFLNPNGDLEASSFYTEKGKPLNGEIEGHHAIIDNTTKEMRALFGYYRDPWVGVSLMPFVDWYYAVD